MRSISSKCFFSSAYGRTVNVIMPRVALTHVTAFISHLHNVMEISLLVSLSHWSDVGQHGSPQLLLASAGHISLCQADAGASRPVIQPKFHQGLYYVLWKWEGKGYDKQVLSKAACETLLVVTNLWTVSRWNLFLLRLFPRGFIKQKFVKTFHRSSLSLKQTCSCSLYIEASQRHERIYFIWTSPFKCFAFSRGH